MDCAVCFGNQAKMQRCGGALCPCCLQICDECLAKWIDKKKRCAVCARRLLAQELDCYVKVLTEPQPSTLSQIVRCLCPWCY